jgi:hypothetical protein
MVKAVSVDSATAVGRMAARGKLQINMDSRVNLMSLILTKYYVREGKGMHALDMAYLEPKTLDTKAPFFISLLPRPCISSMSVQKSAHN